MDKLPELIVPACAVGTTLLSTIFLMTYVKFVSQDEQLEIENLTERVVITGPKVVCMNPFTTRHCTVRKALSLGSMQYCIVKNILTGERRVEVGPKLVSLKPYDKIEEDKYAREKRAAISLKANEFLRLIDDQTGKIRVIRGEVGGFVPEPHEQFLDVGGKKEAMNLKMNEYVKIQNKNTGEVRIEKGESLVFLGPFDEIVDGKKKALSLKANEFVRFIDNQTGKIRVVRGESGCVVPGPDEDYLDVGGKIQAMNLKVWEYVKIQDTNTGEVRTERGEKLVFLGPFEEYIEGKREAIEVDEETAVLVRNKRSGQQRLVTEKVLFFPTNDEEILEVRPLIKLADYEACIVRDKTGRDSFFFGANEEQRSFFLPPYSELVQMVWSRGRRRERRDLVITKLDLRPMYMSFEFNCRTNDNVELVLEGSFFWEVVDLQSMIKFTSDTTGDICNHARSRFIELVSKVTLQEFMTRFNVIAKDVHESDASNFYSQRGVKIHSLEVTGYRCAQRSTAEILEQIIQETTNRMNKLQQQESENEVQLQEIRGDIEEEKAMSELIQIKTLNSNARSRMEGLAEAEKVKSFLEELSTSFPDMDAGTKISLWSTLRKEDALHAISKGNASLYYTPNDVSLSIENHAHEHVDKRQKKSWADDSVSED